MLKLSRSAQQNAMSFMQTQARPLERRVFEYYFLGGPADSVLEELARFQNPDGGFGHGLEADLRLPDSSVISTTVGLQILRDLAARPDHPLAEKAIIYLLGTLDKGCMAWPRVPPAVADAPHAPWWDPNTNRAAQCLDNPRPEIVGYFFDYPRPVPVDLRDSLLLAVIERLEGLPETTIMHDDLLCYVRLAET